MALGLASSFRELRCPYDRQGLPGVPNVFPLVYVAVLGRIKRLAVNDPSTTRDDTEPSCIFEVWAARAGNGELQLSNPPHQ